MNIARDSRNPVQHRRSDRPAKPAPSESDITDLPAIVSFFRRRLLVIGLVTLVAICMGAIYAFTAQPKYTAVAGLLIDNATANLSRIEPAGSPAAEDLVAIETQMQIIRSQRVAIAVVDELDLTNNPNFIPDSSDAITSLIGELRGFLRHRMMDAAFLLGHRSDLAGEYDDLTIDASMEERERAAVLVRQQTGVRRMGASRALEVSYTGNHPQIAAQIANALTAAYVQDRLNSQFEATENAGAWLRERIAELQARSSETALRVQQFRLENNIMDAGGGRGLVGQEQLAAVGQRLIEAADAAALERARHEAIRQTIATEGWDADLSDAGGNELIDTLRGNLIEVTNRIVALEARLEPNAPAIIIATEEHARLIDAIQQEMRRIAERLRAQYEVAIAREQELRDEFNRLMRQANLTSEAQVQLQQLESDAEVLEAAYASYLTRYTEVIQQQSAPFLQARIITPATIPLGASQPQTELILILSAILGGGLGIALAIGLEGSDRTVRLPRHLEKIGLASLGTIPAVGKHDRRLGDGGGKLSKFQPPSLLGRAQTALRSARGGCSQRNMYSRARIASELSFAADAPASAFSNSLRRTRTELSLALGNENGTVIGVTSLSPGEGVTTLASNLARLFAISGRHTLLVDANTHDPTISHCFREPDEDTLSPGSKNFQIMRADELFERLRDPAENDPMLAVSPSDLLGHERMRALLKDVRGHFDYTILDLPAIETVPDVMAAAPCLDTLLIVVEWGRTPVDALESAIFRLRRNGASIAGAILNKVDLREIRLRGHRETDKGYAQRLNA